MIKHDEILDRTSCLNKAAENEPVFVLRAKDRLAPVVVRLWAELAALHGCGEEKVQEANAFADKMETYGHAHGRKFPD